MLRIKGFVYIVIVCIGTLGCFGIAGGEGPAALRIIENDWPPYYIKQNSDNLPGIAKEILNLCIPQTGYRTEFNFYPVKRMYAYMEKGEIDIALFSYRQSRESFVQYGREPMFNSAYRPVVRADSGIDIESLADFDNLKIGHLAGLKYSKPFLAYIEKRHAAGTLITTTIGDSCLRMLLAGIIDVFVDTEATVRWRAQQMGVRDKILILDHDIRTSNYFVTVSNTSPRIADKKWFLEQLDACLKEIKRDGRYDDILHRYGQ